MLDDKTLAPKPNYWGALLWRKLMGTTVLDPGLPIEAGLHVYAHCLRGVPGGVALLVINNDTAASRSINVPVSALRYTLGATVLQSKTVALNGKTLELGQNDALPALTGALTPAGDLRFEPATISFLALASAANGACRAGTQ